MGFDVKNTTLHKLFELVCPHYCMGCGELGAVLCERCKNYNNFEQMEMCLNCGAIARGGMCGECDMPFDRGFAVGKRGGVLQKCVEEYKYSSVRALKTPLAGLLAEVLPSLPENTVVVPVPTNTKHVRRRGLDHTLLMARELARMRGWRCEEAVIRVKNNVQVGASKKIRQEQVKGTYELRGKIKKGVYYVVVDDVWTTGSTMIAICGMLREAGAEDVTAIVLARAGEYRRQR